MFKHKRENLLFCTFYTILHVFTQTNVITDLQISRSVSVGTWTGLLALLANAWATPRASRRSVFFYSIYSCSANCSPRHDYTVKIHLLHGGAEIESKASCFITKFKGCARFTVTQKWIRIFPDQFDVIFDGCFVRQNVSFGIVSTKANGVLWTSIPTKITLFIVGSS